MHHTSMQLRARFVRSYGVPKTGSGDAPRTERSTTLPMEKTGLLCDIRNVADLVSKLDSLVSDP
jgi:hypothetical protein